MSDFFKKLTEINTASKFYRIFAYICLSVAVISILCGYVWYTTLVEQQNANIYVLDKSGNIYTATKEGVQANRPLEARAHVELFIMNFFDIDKLTYKERINRSMDLGTSVIFDLYSKLKDQQRWFANIEQYNITQSVIVESIECANQAPPYEVNADFKIIIKSDATGLKTYQAVMRFTLTEAKERVLNNPHGLIIEKIENLEFAIEEENE